jgi:tRNA nucleotidyltransferase (CCA-adding enzyme)
MGVNIKIPQDVQFIINTLINNEYDGYVVGGCVRDSILKRNPKDWDIATKAKPEEVIKLFDKVILTGLKHGTVTVIINKIGYEITTYRTDGEYEDNRHPKEVVFVNSLKEDLSRRDFTINAMAYNEKQGLVDYFGGMQDLNEKIIKTVGEPKERFNEDALRMLRAIRFSAQLDFKIDKNILGSIKQLKNNIKNISKERIRDEFNKILLCDTRKIKFLKECEVLEFIIPGISDLYEHTLIATEAIESTLHLKLTMLLHDLGKIKTRTTDETGISHYYDHAKESTKMAEIILKGLKYDNDIINKVLILIQYHDCILKSKLSVKRMLNKIGEDLFRDLIKVKRADALAQNPVYSKEILLNLIDVGIKFNLILEQNECFTLKDLKINGKDLMNIGFNEGKEIGETLNYLLDIVIGNSEINERQKLIKLAKEKLRT